MNKYYQLTQTEKNASVYIYGDITDEKWNESDVTAKSLASELKNINAENITVYINSYGGSVAAGLAIYNTLKNHPAKVTTIVDGFACSIASVIFMAGDERIMNRSSLLMVHNAWTITAGDSDDLRKTADDLDVITQSTINAYMEKINISEEELRAMLDAETWLLPEEALEMGFATNIIEEQQTSKAAASARKALFSLFKTALKKEQPPVDEPIEQTLKQPEQKNLNKFITALLR